MEIEKTSFDLAWWRRTMMVWESRQVGSLFTVVLVGSPTRSRGSGHVFLCSIDPGSLPTVLGYTLMLYALSGRKSEAVELLRGMAEKNLFSWTALIAGLVHNGQWIDGFNLFIEMRRAGVDIVDPFILSSIVGGSANLAALELGK
ncbi:Pentatricopeptide repeat-containing protein [Camellia lanceoleosa]|uniref:Pentatricopeptide repeat-containing protein n=1 Tax=Camellia lanceoleosa TaxID=1840588 RepID=A0ACC0H893_9ERIC|nr:Pentatricopeptide repeat-containing protein [Camellia lanceoleosa]